MIPICAGGEASMGEASASLDAACQGTAYLPVKSITRSQ